MKREEIKAIFADATDEQLKSILDLYGADVEREKSKRKALEAELEGKKEDLNKLNTELETLKNANAEGSEWKTKFEALQAESLAKAKAAEAERILKEKNETTSNRFKAAYGNKEFYNAPTKDYYLAKFREAIEAEENQGKADTDILYGLTKDDPTAFKGVTSIKLAGGRETASGKQYSSKEEIMAIADREERRTAIAENLNLFDKGD